MHTYKLNYCCSVCRKVLIPIGLSREVKPGLLQTIFSALRIYTFPVPVFRLLQQSCCVLGHAEHDFGKLGGHISKCSESLFAHLLVIELLHLVK